MSSISPTHNGPGPAASIPRDTTSDTPLAQTYRPGHQRHAAHHDPAPQLEITARVDGHTTVLHLAGELDIANTNQLRQQIRLVLHQHDPHELVLDLSQLAFADSSALAVMIWAHNQLTARYRQLSLRHPNPQLAQILDITGLHRHLSITPSPRPPHRSEVTARAAAARTRAAHEGNGYVDSAD